MVRSTSVQKVRSIPEVLFSLASQRKARLPTANVDLEERKSLEPGLLQKYCFFVFFAYQCVVPHDLFYGRLIIF